MNKYYSLSIKQVNFVNTYKDIIMVIIVLIK